VFALSANTGNFETTGYARNCYVTTGETGSFLVGKIGTNINLGDSSNKSRLNEKSFLGAGVCNNQSGICCSFLGAGQCNQQHGWFSETGACIMDLYYPPGVLSGLGFGEASFLGAGCCNRQCGDYASFLGAGQKNRQFFNRHSFLGGGSYIYQSGSIGSFLGAGYYNSQQITLDSFIGAGYNNSLRAQWYSAIAAGYHNAINGVNDTGFYGSFIGAGLYNKICGSTHSSILAGENNQISGGRNVFVLGSGITANDQSNILYVNNLCVVSGIISGNGAGLTGLTAAAALCSGVNTLYESFVVNPVVNANLINFDVIPNSTLYYTGNTSTNFYLNLRGNASCTFNSILPLNNSLSTTFIHVNSSTAYCLTGISIDGVTQTIKWAGGGGVAAGITSSTNIYSITTFKTGNNLYCNFVSLGFFS
jgi:hypothetical protein